MLKQQEQWEERQQHKRNIDVLKSPYSPFVLCQCSGFWLVGLFHFVSLPRMSAGCWPTWRWQWAGWAEEHCQPAGTGPAWCRPASRTRDRCCHRGPQWSHCSVGPYSLCQLENKTHIPSIFRMSAGEQDTHFIYIMCVIWHCIICVSMRTRPQTSSVVCASVREQEYTLHQYYMHQLANKTIHSISILCVS